MSLVQHSNSNSHSVDLPTCNCSMPCVDKIDALHLASKNESKSFSHESVQTAQGVRIFRVEGEEQKLQELVTLKNGSSEWRKHNDNTIKLFYFSEGMLYNNQCQQVGELLLNPDHIDLNDKLIKGVGIVRIEGKDFQFDGKNLSLVTDPTGKKEWGLVLVGKPPVTDLSPQEIYKRLSTTLAEVVDYKLDALAPEISKLLEEVKKDLNGDKLDHKKVNLLQAYACMATETFDPKSDAHQQMVKATISSLHDLVTIADQKALGGSNFKSSPETLTNLKAIEGMFHVLCVDKENIIGDLVNAGHLSKESPISIFRDKIIDFKSKSQEELKELAQTSLDQIRSERDPEKRTNAYLTLSALYYTQKNDPGFKEQLKQGLIEFAKNGFQTEKEAIAGAIFMAHTSWDKLSPEQLNTVYNSPIKNLVLPFTSILTNVVPEGDPNGVTSKEGWQQFLTKYPDSATQNSSETTQEVLKIRLKLLGVTP